MTHRLQNIFHTQGGFSVLTLLAFGDEKYYICTEIWEEPRLPPFFVTFPLKSGIQKRIREKLGEGKEKFEEGKEKFEEGKEKLCAEKAKLGGGKCSRKLKMLMSNR